MFDNDLYIFGKDRVPITILMTPLKTLSTLFLSGGVHKQLPILSVCEKLYLSPLPYPG